MQVHIFLLILLIIYLYQQIVALIIQKTARNGSRFNGAGFGGDISVRYFASHGLPFIGIHTRVKQLHDHHQQERFNEVLQACNEKACHAMEILPIMFKRELDLHQTTFALGEVVAHLNALWHEGKLGRHLHEDGIYRFKTVIGFEI